MKTVNDNVGLSSALDDGALANATRSMLMSEATFKELEKKMTTSPNASKWYGNGIEILTNEIMPDRIIICRDTRGRMIGIIDFRSEEEKGKQ